MGISKKQKIFIPFTIDKRFWNKDMPNVFLNKVYEAQIEPGDKDIQYTTLQTYYTYAKDERFQDFCDRFIEALGEALNQYHGLNESNRFWRAMLWFWVQEYAGSMQFKIEQFKNLQKTYPPEQYTYCSYAKKLNDPYQFLSRNDARYVVDDEEYHFATYFWMAENIFDFHVENQDIQNQDIQNNEMKSKKGVPAIYEMVRNAFVCFIKSVMSTICTIYPSQARVGLYQANYGGWRTLLKWFLRSRGAIQEISLPIEQHDYKIDNLFRESLPKILNDKTNASEEEHIILEFLPYAFPPFFIEQFKNEYNAAIDYLREHKNVVVIYTLISMLESSAGKICELLLQKRGGKVIGQQHGGTYQVTTNEQEQGLELEWNDMFYYWGKSALTYHIAEFPNCKIMYGPTYKLSRSKPIMFFGKKRSSLSTGHFLFVGTALEAYPRAYTYGDVDGEKWEYIQRKIRFLSALSEMARQKMIVREFPTQYGWHMPEIIKEKVSEVQISVQENFDDLLSGCALFISDNLATPWMEAIFFEKPVIFLLFPYEISIQNNKFREEEKKYFKMLEEVGVIIHSPEEAADLVSRLGVNGVTDWWMDEKRQSVMKVVRERWTTKVDDIDDWWYCELMAQAEKIEWRA